MNRKALKCVLMAILFVAGSGEDVLSGRARAAEVTITEADNGKTIHASVGQEVRVSLKGDQKQTGWEVSQPEGEALIPVTVGGSYGNAKTPAVEFAPDRPGEHDIGTYSFRYKAVALGTSKLRFVYVYPGGSRPTPRKATRLVREFNVTVEVSAAATAGELMDAKLAQNAPVILRVKLLRTAGADKYAWCEVEILKVLKNESGETFGRTLKIAAYSWKPGVPEGESTAYLERYNATDKGLWKLAGGEAATGVSHAQKPGEAAANPPAAIAWQDLFAGEKWYRSQAGKETIFAGKLEAVPQAGGFSTLQRTSYYKLGVRTIYTGARKVEALDRLVGHAVEIRGKAVDMGLEGQGLREIWPAAIRPAR